MKIGICDDNVVYLDELRALVSVELSAYPDVTIETLTPAQIFEHIQHSTLTYDLLITDIDMGEYNGITLALEINKLKPKCIIIFISNYLNFATDVYEIQHIYFILKSEMGNRLHNALTKALTILDERKQQLVIRYHNIETSLSLSDIYYLEALGRYLYVHDNTQTYKYIQSLKGISASLNAQFVRCHHSYIVNLGYIKSISRTSCTLTSGEVLPISQTYAKNVSNSYMSYISNKML